ncbi:MAG: hypothetical protein RRB13_12800 [bacterium]|nr:hypothetical protein [bacterium]
MFTTKQPQLNPALIPPRGYTPKPAQDFDGQLQASMDALEPAESKKLPTGQALLKIKHNIGLLAEVYGHARCA